MIALNEKDRILLDSKAITESQVNEQIERFKKGYSFVNLYAPALISKGIIRLNTLELNEMISFFDANKGFYTITKFVPASGAASRMFKNLYAFIEKYKDTPIPDDFLLQENPPFDSPENFFINLQNFAFYDDLKSCLSEKGMDIEQLIAKKELVKIVQTLLEDGLEYGHAPKALLKFHRYEDRNRFAVEEHLVEAATYARSNENIAKLHFTISPEHREAFERIVAETKSIYEKKFGITYDISFSEQKPSTDTIAVDLNNEPFRNDNGSLLFRPAGHGALIENLNDLKEEIIFIKNIDNIVPDRLKEDTFKYKKAIGGYLLYVQQKTSKYLELLADGNVTEDELAEIVEFSKERMLIDLPIYFGTFSEIEKIDFLFSKLNRPIRVCGMVKNEGEPGGGPYWVKSPEDEISLQIVESSQMDLQKESQEKIFHEATHFNPVDLVCSTYDFTGEKFDLTVFVDERTGFISVKSKDGRDLKAIELPGLWNGAMADWNTIFIEIPIITFNPVKTINDLLRPNHQ
ncbi:MAG: DUF4301 family protein [Lentimicrobiaceae bacterium]|jgi:hypothetical protein|nr:DUF4301 family protein [Lentimicrobiaceae bacterium]